MVIKVENYTKILNKNIILDNINISFESGKVYGLNGVNGSGKTMLLRAICGLIIPTKGNVYIDDKKIPDDISFPPSIGMLIENPSFISNYTGFQNLKTIASLKNIVSENDIKKIILSVGLDPNDRRTFKKYSLGMKQKLGIVAAIMENPRLLILDEPLNAIDKSGVKQIKNIIKELKSQGTLIIITCHSFEELKELSDVIVTIDNAKIIDIQKVEELK